MVKHHGTNLVFKRLIYDHVPWYIKFQLFLIRPEVAADYSMEGSRFFLVKRLRGHTYVVGVWHE